MNDIWLEEDLLFTKNSLSKDSGFTESNSNNDSGIDELVRSTKGVVRIHQPRWELLSIENNRLLTSGNNVRFVLIKLGFEFEIPDSASKTAFSFARCEAYIRSADQSPNQPIVYEIFPKDLYDGEPRKVAIKVGPQFTFGDYGGSIGEIATDLSVGRVIPSVIGWKGKNEQTPFWELRPIKKQLLGIQNLWVVVEMPLYCKKMRISVRAEGELQTHLGAFAVGPQERSWEHRPSILIEI